MAGNRKHGFRRGNRTNMRPQIETVKAYIKNATKPFDGDGYVFKQALKEVRELGYIVKYISEKCHYVLVA